MAKSYRRYLPEQDLLLPPSLREWLPENHLAYFVSDVVDSLDLSAMDAVYGDEERGQPPYDPRMMTKVLVYGYCVGVVQFAPDREAVGGGRGVSNAGGR
jgi:transposase